MWSIGEMCKYFRKDRRTITNWVNENPPCPSVVVKRSRTFEPGDVLAWFEARAERRGQVAGEKTQPASFEAAKLRKLEAEAREAEMRVAKMIDSVIPVEAHEAVIIEICDQLRAVLLNVPGTYSVELERLGVSAVDAERILEAIMVELTHALRRVADAIETQADQIELGTIEPKKEEVA